ncbi:MAG TPA: hypothetical protein VFO58_24550 [Vicinamibacterales bacterium]|nr:hypothetical protein [Vicinamibacterales bacterium]
MSRPPVGGPLFVAGITVAIVVTWLGRFLIPGITNDHYVHLSRGWQILQGDVPTRDFFDPGLVLQYYTSAAVLLWSGHNLFGETALTAAFMAAGAGLTFAAAARLSRSLWLAACATVIATMSLPRLYNYPKSFFYVLAIVVAWRYAHQPGRGALVWLAVLTSVAFLFRHDHAVYIAASLVIMLAIRHWDQPRRAVTSVAQYTALALLLVSPFLVFIQTTTGLTRYIGGSSNQLGGLATFRFNRLPVHVDLDAPLLTVAPPSDDDPSKLARLQRRFPALRVQLLPGFFTSGNAFAWFYYVTFLLPFVGLLLVARASWRGDVGRAEAAVAGMASVLCVILVQTLVRGSPDSRLPDVANPIAVVAAWVSARCLRAAIGTKPWVRRATMTLVAAGIVITAWSVGTFAETMANVRASRILSEGIGRRVIATAELLQARPIDAWPREAPGLGGLMRYVFECTADTDRLFVTWFGPDVYFTTERRFAGGQAYLVAGWHASPEDQRLTVSRLEQQRVPIVIEKTSVDYEAAFPLVAEYVRSRYGEVPVKSDSMRDYRVLVDKGLTPTGTYEPLGTPCYR